MKTISPGDVIYEHNGKQCLFSEIPCGESVIVFGVVQDNGTIKKHRENLGVKA